ncbi:TIGR03621 family F420-dependent LLM class oxidoreductase [Nocardiopsis coralliicola]
MRGADPAGWPAQSREAEQAGLDALLAPDHLGAPAPFAMLAAAAVATERVALGTLVANNEFWNPALLAREAATVARLSGGRLELGLGLGHMKSEFEAAGIPWRGHPERCAAVERTLDALPALFAEQEPVIDPPRLLIGGHGERTLELAARRADIVGFGGLTQRRGARMGVFDIAGPDDVERRVDFVRAKAGGRLPGLEFTVLVQSVVLTDDAERGAAALAAEYGAPGLQTAADVLASPFVLVGTVAEIADELAAHRDRFGFTYITAHGGSRDALIRVAAEVRRREGE